MSSEQEKICTVFFLIPQWTDGLTILFWEEKENGIESGNGSGIWWRGPEDDVWEGRSKVPEGS